VTVSVADPGLLGLSGLTIIDPRTGAPVPIQRLSAFTVAFRAMDIPSMGYRAFPVLGGDPLPQHAGLAGLTLENGYYRVDIDQTTGSVKAIQDKAMGQGIVSADGIFDLYRFNGTGLPGPLTVVASDSGPVLQRIVLAGTAPGSSSYQTTIALPSGDKRIDFRTDFNRLTPTISTGEDIDFYFNVATSAPSLTYEIPFGYVSLFTDELSGFHSKHYAPQHWMYLSLDGATKGVTLATAESPIIAASSGTFTGSLRLLTQYNNPSTAYRAGVGPQQMLFSVTSGSDGFRPDKAAEFSWGAVTPLPAIVVPAGQDGALPDTAYSLVTFSPERIQLSTIKRSSNGQGIILRLYNPSGEQLDEELTFGGRLTGATETSLQEVDRNAIVTGGNSLSLSFKPFEVKTVRATLDATMDVQHTASSPATFALQQNYPNPFNPRTVVSWELPAVSTVTLTVYDVLGQEVQVLVNERMAAGKHSVTFDALRLASGIYFYRLEASAGNGTTMRQTRSMMLLK
jgi:hypothetical protein